MTDVSTVDLSFLFSVWSGRRRVGDSSPEDWEAILAVLRRHRAIETTLTFGGSEGEVDVPGSRLRSNPQCRW